MESCQAPIDAADAQVFGKVILQLISPLFVSVSASALTCFARRQSVLCPDFECKPRVCPRPGSALQAMASPLHRLFQVLQQATWRLRL